MRLALWIFLLILIGVMCYQRYKRGRVLGVLLIIPSVIVLVYIVLGVLLFLMQSRMLYQPSTSYTYAPSDYGMKHEELSLSTSDGVTLAGWFVPSESAKRTVLFCHGNAGNISHRLDTLKMFHELRLNCLIVDYRGYGKSTGKPTEIGTKIDILAGFQWLIEEKGMRPEEIILFGRSLGGSIAAMIAKDVDPGGLVLESVFTSFDDVGAHYYPWLPVRLFSRFNYNTVEAVKHVRCPVLVIHSRDDEIIPYKFGQEVFAAANDPKQFAELKGTHNEGFYNHNGLYKQIWRDWLEQLAVSSEQ